MSNNELLVAISDMMEEKLDRKLDEKLNTILNEKLNTILDDKLHTILDEKLSTILDEKLTVILDEKLNLILDEKLNLIFDEKLDQVFDDKLSPIIHDIQQLKLDNETNIIPRLQNIEACYLSTYERYVQAADSFEETKADVDCLKKVVSQHSEQLSHIRCLA